MIYKYFKKLNENNALNGIEYFASKFKSIL